MIKAFRTNRHDGKKKNKSSLVKILYYPNREQAYWFKTYEIIEYEKPEDVINDIENITKRLASNLKRDVARDPNAFNPSKRRKEAGLGVGYVQSDKVIERGYET